MSNSTCVLNCQQPVQFKVALFSAIVGAGTVTVVISS